ncbi:hypothetical protein [Saccharibacillus alkalitolerans]|uniref:Uncharacterized protein n=1 Tax=Saccharibacillus alkalitolerans TaxID=2705290 RepID=A0ABX0FAE9_9BACL|nr:hypothetical protein [Saccharibacillus alkalitolerans]NGZ77918.1 hypothetical protein [Saccharibacillus alkalitolerans]
MDIFIYIGNGLTAPKDEIEDALDDMLQDRGEVTGGGGGNTGFNIDIETFDDDSSLIEEVKAVLKGFRVPIDASIVIDGQRFAVYDQEQ